MTISTKNLSILNVAATACLSFTTFKVILTDGGPFGFGWLIFYFILPAYLVILAFDWLLRSCLLNKALLRIIQTITSLGIILFSLAFSFGIGL